MSFHMLKTLIVNYLYLLTIIISFPLQGFATQNSWEYKWSKTAYNSTQIRVYAKTNLGSSLVAVGRDINNNDSIDTWFVQDFSKGFRILQVREFKSQKLTEKYISEFLQKISFKKIVATEAFTHIFSFLFSTIDQIQVSYQSYLENYINLKDLQLRVSYSYKTSIISIDQKKYFDDFLDEAFEVHNQYYDHIFGSQTIKNAILDSTMWTLGGHYLSKSLHFLTRFTPKTLSAALRKRLRSFKISSKQKKIFSRSAFQLAYKKTIERKLPLYLNNIFSKSKVKRAIFTSLNTAKRSLLKTLKQNTGYVLFNSALHLGVESYFYYDEVYDESPQKMAKNLFNHPEIMQNVGYMTSSSFLTVAATHAVSGKYKTFALCGLVTLASSGAMSLWMQGENNPKRMAIDLGWEVGIGNSLVMLDVAALKKFEQLSVAKSNSKLKLIGWAVVLTNALVGYASYSMLTQLDYNDTHLVPLFAKADD